ncbi:hypothetical protein [Aquaspirillum soli]
MKGKAKYWLAVLLVIGLGVGGQIGWDIAMTINSAFHRSAQQNHHLVNADLNFGE